MPTTHLHLVPKPQAPVVPSIDRNEAIARIKAGLKARTGRSWSVTGGRGTAWGWITITAPPARRESSVLQADDQAMLSMALGMNVHGQGEKVPASNAYRVEFVARAEGRTPEAHGVQYWD